MVWRPDPTAVQGVTLFGTFVAGTGGRQYKDYFLNGGAVLTGTFLGRPYDTLGVGFALEHFSPLGLANYRSARARRSASTTAASPPRRPSWS